MSDIKRWDTQEVIHSLEGGNITIKDCVEDAVKKGISLFRANLKVAYLKGASLYRADLVGANIGSADLEGANLEGADLRGAYLRYANLYRANLRGADLRGADLKGVNLKGATLPDQICPKEGEFYGWKATTHGVVKLLIPEDAKRVNPLGSNKCRANKVIPISGAGLGGIGVNYNGIIYEKDILIEESTYNDDIREVCTNGIHFFMTEEEALKWFHQQI